MKLRLALDMDGVIVDLLPQWLKKYNIIWDDDLSVDDIEGWRVKDYVYKEAEDYLENMLKLPDFYIDLPPIENSIDTVNKIIKSDKFEVFIVTNPFVRESISQKVDWITKHLPDIEHNNIMFVGNKSLANADIMIDDSFENLEDFLDANPKSVGLLYDMPYNRDKFHDGIVRVYDWEDIYKELVLGGF